MWTRRHFLRTSGIAAASGLAGCASGTDGSSQARRTSSTPTRGTESSGSRSVLYVAPEGRDENPGTRASPIGRIQAAIERAGPGTTIQVRTGEYRERLETTRAGSPGKPITIAGPANAIVRPPADDIGAGGFDIFHSHIQLLGLTLDGLGNTDQPSDPDSYSFSIISAGPPTWKDEYPDYLTDVKIKPRRIGNGREKLIAVTRVNGLEIGAFEVIGPAGFGYLDDPNDYGMGEVVSVGRSTNNFGTDHYPWPGPDRSHGIHIHHIGNLEGHHHTELVKLHAGHYDVTVEYCTDAGGFGRAPGSGSSIDVRCAQTTVRWCDLKNGRGHGILVDDLGNPEEESVHNSFGSIPDPQYPGRNNAVYGNRISDVEGQPIVVRQPESQRVICGNEADDESIETFSESCPDEIPLGEGVGYTGGEGSES